MTSLNRRPGLRTLAHAAQGPEAILANLDPQQREVALAARGPVCVLAGAGTARPGRSRTALPISRLRAGRSSPGAGRDIDHQGRRRTARQAAATGAARAGADLEKVRSPTFHSAALRQLTHFWPSTIGGSAPRVLESKISLVAEAARRLGSRPACRSCGMPRARSNGSRSRRYGRRTTRRPVPRRAGRRRWIRAPWPGSRGLRGTAHPAAPGRLRVCAGADGRHPRGVPGGAPRSGTATPASWSTSIRM